MAMREGALRAIAFFIAYLGWFFLLYGIGAWLDPSVCYVVQKDTPIVLAFVGALLGFTLGFTVELVGGSAP